MKAGNSKAVSEPFDVAVVIPTIVRPSLLEALGSIYRQSFPGTVQILVGIDKLLGDPEILDQMEQGLPDNMTLTLFDPEYSTSSRHGGVHTARDGGSLRTMLSFLAHSRYVAYLDDDNLWHKNHLLYLMEAVKGKEWAFSYRWLVDEDTNRKIIIDKWHSVGPDKGIMKGTTGGFADPNTLLIDKIACLDLLYLWSQEIEGKRQLAGADRRFFSALSKFKSFASSNRATVYYKMRRTNVLWKNIIEEKSPQTIADQD
ncbi:MAG: glycosyltransferase family 2 protein [Sneathiellales bacterium]|nr:glycosyltransferase family 2 protein [Sneathiellales bacterium]